MSTEVQYIAYKPLSTNTNIKPIFFSPWYKKRDNVDDVFKMYTNFVLNSTEPDIAIARIERTETGIINSNPLFKESLELQKNPYDAQMKEKYITSFNHYLSNQAYQPYATIVADDDGYINGGKVIRQNTVKKTNQTYTGRDGVKRVVYSKNGKNYIKKRDPKTGKFVYKQVKM